MPNPSSQDIEIYNRTQRPNFSESLVYYIDNELKQIEKAIRNIKMQLSQLKTDLLPEDYKLCHHLEY